MQENWNWVMFRASQKISTPKNSKNGTFLQNGQFGMSEWHDTSFQANACEAGQVSTQAHASSRPEFR